MRDFANDNRMTLGEHFEELRRSMLRALLGIGVGMVACLFFGETIMQVMYWPVEVAQRATTTPVKVVALSPAESFSVYLKVCLIWGIFVASPYSIYQLWKFVAAGLYPKERRLVYRYVPFSVVLFLAGVVFFFVTMGPVCMTYFLNFGQKNFPVSGWSNPLEDLLRGKSATQPASQPATTAVVIPELDGDPDSPREGQVWTVRGRPGLRVFRDGRVYEVDMREGASMVATELRLSDSIMFVAMLSLVFGLGFQMPIVVLALAGAGIVSVASMARYRKYVVLALLVTAGLLTPPDVISQVSLAGPMYLLYELGLLLARLVGRKQRLARA